MIDFPNSPTTGQIFQNWKWDGTKWVAIGSGASITVSDTAPASPTAGALWWDSVGGQLYLYYTDPNSSEWVPATNQGSPPRSPPPSNPNKLINPFMEIDQANEGAAVTATGSSRCIDGFYATITSSSATASSQRSTTAPPTGYSFSLAYTMGTAASSIAAGDNIQIFQNIEADDINDTAFGTANAQPLTFSFWAACTVAGTYAVSLRNGAANRSYVSPFTITTANTWQLFTVTIPGDTAGTWALSGNAGAMSVVIALMSGTTYQTSSPNTWLAGIFLAATGITNTFAQTAGAVFRLGPCKLEVGSAATPMLRQSFQQELARCQRYYEKSYDPGTALGTVTANGVSAINAQMPSGVNGGTTASFKVTKRAQPTMTLYSPGTGASGKARDLYNAVDITVGVGPALNAFSWSCAPSAVSYAMGANWVADARL